MARSTNPPAGFADASTNLPNDRLKIERAICFPGCLAELGGDEAEIRARMEDPSIGERIRATYALANERVGIPRYEMSSQVLDLMVGELKARGAFGNAIVRAKAAEAAAACEAARLLVYRVVDERARGVPPGTAANLARVAVVEADHAVTDFGMDFLPDCFSGDGHAGMLAHHERAIVTGIAAGAAEIQLNLVARRHLDLPKGA